MLTFPSQQSLTVMQVDGNPKCRLGIERGAELHHSTRWTAYCIGQTSAAPGTLFTSEPVNRRKGGESEVDRCLASLDSLSFTRSLSIGVTSYERHFRPLDSKEKESFSTDAQGVENNTNHQASEGLQFAVCLWHSDKIQRWKR